MIFKSSDGGTDWSLVDRYFGETDWASNKWNMGDLPAVAAADQNGNVYVARQGYAQVAVLEKTDLGRHRSQEISIKCTDMWF